MPMHRWVSADEDADSCLECGITVDTPDAPVATRDLTVGARVVPTTFTALELMPRCTGVRREGEAHHFAPTVDGIACHWCAVEITPDSGEGHVPADCIRPE